MTSLPATSASSSSSSLVSSSSGSSHYYHSHSQSHSGGPLHYPQQSSLLQSRRHDRSHSQGHFEPAAAAAARTVKIKVHVAHSPHSFDVVAPRQTLTSELKRQLVSKTDVSTDDQILLIEDGVRLRPSAALGDYLSLAHGQQLTPDDPHYAKALASLQQSQSQSQSQSHSFDSSSSDEHKQPDHAPRRPTKVFLFDRVHLKHRPTYKPHQVVRLLHGSQAQSQLFQSHFQAHMHQLQPLQQAVAASRVSGVRRLWDMLVLFHRQNAYARVYLDDLAAKHKQGRSLSRGVESRLLALKTAFLNLNGHRKVMNKAFDAFWSKYNETRERWLYVLRQFEPWMMRLIEVELHEALRKEQRRTLLDCFSEGKLRNWRDECLASMEQLHTKVLREVKSLKDKTEQRADEERELLPLHRIKTVYTELQDVAKAQDEIKTLCQVLAKDTASAQQALQQILAAGQSHGENAPQASSLVEETLAALDTKRQNHEQLIMSRLSEVETNAAAVLDKHLQHDQYTFELFFKKLSLISELTNAVRSIEHRCTLYDAALDQVQQKFVQLEKLEKMPEAYYASLPEISRRRAFRELFHAHSSGWIKVHQRLRDEELSRRQEFVAKYGQYLPKNFIPALYEAPPLYKLAELEFDTALPEIDIGDDPHTRQLRDRLLQQERETSEQMGTKPLLLLTRIAMEQQQQKEEEREPQDESQKNEQQQQQQQQQQPERQQGSAGAASKTEPKQQEIKDDNDAMAMTMTESSMMQQLKQANSFLLASLMMNHPQQSPPLLSSTDSSSSAFSSAAASDGANHADDKSAAKLAELEAKLELEQQRRRELEAAQTALTRELESVKLQNQSLRSDVTRVRSSSDKASKAAVEFKAKWEESVANCQHQETRISKSKQKVAKQSKKIKALEKEYKVAHDMLDKARTAMSGKDERIAALEAQLKQLETALERERSRNKDAVESNNNNSKNNNNNNSKSKNNESKKEEQEAQRALIESLRQQNASLASQVDALKGEEDLWKTVMMWKISFTSFQEGDLVLFQRIGDSDDYVAFNRGSPHYYLSEGSVAVLEPSIHVSMSCVVGRVVEIHDAQIASPQDNPFGLPDKTKFYTVTVELVPLVDHDADDVKSDEK